MSTGFWINSTVLMDAAEKAKVYAKQRMEGRRLEAENQRQIDREYEKEREILRKKSLEEKINEERERLEKIRVWSWLHLRKIPLSEKVIESKLSMFKWIRKPSYYLPPIYQSFYENPEEIEQHREATRLQKMAQDANKLMPDAQVFLSKDDYWIVSDFIEVGDEC